MIESEEVSGLVGHYALEIEGRRPQASSNGRTGVPGTTLGECTAPPLVKVRRTSRRFRPSPDKRRFARRRCPSRPRLRTEQMDRRGVAGRARKSALIREAWHRCGRPESSAAQCTANDLFASIAPAWVHSRRRVLRAFAGFIAASRRNAEEGGAGQASITPVAVDAA